MENLYGMTNILMIALLFCMVYDLLFGRSNDESSDEDEFIDDDYEFIDDDYEFSILSKAKEYIDNLFKLRVKVEIFDNGFVANKYNFSKELLSTDEYNNLNTVLMGIVKTLEFTKVDESSLTDCNDTDDNDLDCEDYFDYIIEKTERLVKGLTPLMVDVDDSLRYLEDVGYKLLFSKGIEDSKKLMVECTDRMIQLSESLKCLEGEV